MKIFCTVVIMMLSSMMAQDKNPAATPATAPQGAAVANPQQPTAPIESDAPESTAIDALPRKYVELWNTGNFDLMKSFFSPFYMNSHGHKSPVNEAGLTRVIKAWRESIPDLNFKILDTITQGDKVVMRLSFAGTYKTRMFSNTVQPISSAPPRFIRVTEILIFQMKNNRIVEIWEEYDELAMRTQMGARWILNGQLDAAQLKDFPIKKGSSTPTHRPAPSSK